MTTNSALEPLITQAAQHMGVALSKEQTGALIQYLEQLERWNKTYNLTAIQSTHDRVVHHVLDSLSVVPVLRQFAESVNKDSLHVLDVGSGAGLPGIIIAIATGYPVQCIDAVEKKATFIRFVAGVLQLNGVVSHHERVEALPSLQVDVVISRAFSSLSDFVKLAGHHVADEGVMLAMKGKLPNAEIQALKDDSHWRVGKLHDLVVPELDAERCLVEIYPTGKQ